MSKPIALILDTGIAVEHAVRLSEMYDVKYWTHYFSAYPRIEDFLPGYGYGEIEKVDNFGLWIDKAALIATFDIGYGDLIHYFRTKGKTCFGAGLGEKMETDRWWMKQELKRAGLDVVNTVKVKGTDSLQAYLKSHPGVVLKVNTFRGNLESLLIPDYPSVELLIDTLNVSFGGAKKVVEFIVEDQTGEAVEVGADYIFSPSNGFLLPGMWGIEKDGAYIGRFDNVMPKWFKRVLPLLSKLMKQFNYRGFLSTEQRLTKDGGNYLIDMTTRIPLSLGHIFTEALLNYSEVVTCIAQDRKVIPLVRKKWWGCLPVFSSELEKNHVRLVFPEKVKRNVKITGGYKIGEEFFVPRGNHTLCSVIYGGDSMEEVKEGIEEVLEEIKAPRKDANLSLLDSISEDFKKLEEV